jgi:hypothetical protein
MVLRPPSGSRWVIWKVEGHANVDGTNGNVDLA